MQPSYFHHGLLSAASQPMIDAINRVLEELRDYWPVTLRTVH